MYSRILLLTIVAIAAATVSALAQQTCLEGRPPQVDFGLFEANKPVSRAIDVFNKSNGNATISEMHLTQGNNAFILQPRILPIFMPPQGLATITVDAMGTDTSRVYRDTLFIRSDCGNVLIPLSFSTTDKQPGPQITGYDFGTQWVTEGNCTKNPANEYAGRVEVYNTGTAEMTVNRVSILGADAGFFSLGSGERINQGDRVAAAFPADTARRGQTIIFKPGPQERAYSAVVEVATIDGKTARNTIMGVGVESHMTLSADSLSSTVGIGRPKDSVEFTANFAPTRPTTITNVAISPAGSFTLETPRGEIVKTFQPGQNVRIRLGFQPTVEGKVSAKITLSGNFTNCEDSVVVLSGNGIIVVSAPDESASFGVSEPMPNPTTGAASIAVTLARQSHVRVELIDSRGRNAGTVVDETVSAGSNRLSFDVGNLASGTYTLRTTVDDDARVITRTIVVVR